MDHGDVRSGPVPTLLQRGSLPLAACAYALCALQQAAAGGHAGVQREGSAQEAEGLRGALAAHLGNVCSSVCRQMEGAMGHWGQMQRKDRACVAAVAAATAAAAPHFASLLAGWRAAHVPQLDRGGERWTGAISCCMQKLHGSGSCNVLHRLGLAPPPCPHVEGRAHMHGTEPWDVVEEGVALAQLALTAPLLALVVLEAGAAPVGYAGPPVAPVMAGLLRHPAAAQALSCAVGTLRTAGGVWWGRTVLPLLQSFRMAAVPHAAPRQAAEGGPGGVLGFGGASMLWSRAVVEWAVELGRVAAGMGAAAGAQW